MVHAPGLCRPEVAGLHALVSVPEGQTPSARRKTGVKSKIEIRCGISATLYQDKGTLS